MGSITPANAPFTLASGASILMPAAAAPVPFGSRYRRPDGVATYFRPDDITPYRRP